MIKNFLKNESAGGILLIICTAISLILTNSPLHDYYVKIWDFPMWNHNFAHWINDGLMAIFFLVVGLELKKEIFYGELSDRRTASLPLAGAIGGMIVPALIYMYFNNGTDTQSGAGIPMATDIAFALAILTLVGKNVPLALKVFLTALAVIDDLGAIIVIAIFYTTTLYFINLLIALAIFALLIILDKVFKIKILIIYLIAGIFMWYFMLHSGIHATITGVLLAFAIPSNKDEKACLSTKLEHMIHKPVNFIVLPLFALANTVITIDSSSFHAITEHYSLGIFFGLFLGKPLGITLFAYLTCKIGICKLPKIVNWKMIIGAGCLGGIGFTMSIFISLLAFDPVEHVDYINNAKFMILVASMCSAIVGFILLKIFCKEKHLNPLES